MKRDSKRKSRNTHMTPEDIAAISKAMEAVKEAKPKLGKSPPSKKQLAEFDRRTKILLATLDRVRARVFSEMAFEADGSGQRLEKQRGFQCGYQWGGGHAEEEEEQAADAIRGLSPPAQSVFPELERLDRFGKDLKDQPHLGSWDVWLSTDSGDGFSKAERLYFVMHPENDGDCNMAHHFWEFVVGDADEAKQLTGSPAFLQGFVMGALEAWFVNTFDSDL